MSLFFLCTFSCNLCRTRNYVVYLCRDVKRMYDLVNIVCVCVCVCVAGLVWVGGLVGKSGMCVCTIIIIVWVDGLVGKSGVCVCARIGDGQDYLTGKTRCISDGLFSDPLDCRMFVWCRDGIAQRVSCQHQMFFNPRTGKVATPGLPSKGHTPMDTHKAYIYSRASVYCLFAALRWCCCCCCCYS